MSGDDPITGVVLVNTGTPTAPHAAQVRQFLSRFLADPRVVELPRWLWLPLLKGVILPLRSPHSARNYRRIWREDGSPLAVYSARLRAALEQALQQQPGTFKVELAFLYSESFVGAALERLRAAGARQIVVLPMFPQCSGTTTGAVFDQVGAVLRRWRALPQLRVVADFHDDPLYIAALANSVREHWQQQTRSSHLLMSFHGIPEQCVKRGDPYQQHCRTTAQLLATALELPADRWTLSFQSRFGKARWLEPATDITLQQLARDGQRSLSVICPGFSVDCLETLEEIAIGGREIFLHAGGEQFDYIGALNERSDHARALAQLVLPTPAAAQ
jgi:protoporphyrin/coproporphyrin ferrochelatase